MVEEDQDDDDVEKVSWSGEPVGSKMVLLHVPGQSSDWLQRFSTCLLRYLLVCQRNRGIQSEGRERARLP